MRIAATFAIIFLLQASAVAQTTQSVTSDDPMSAINALRTELVDSFNKGDLPRLLSHVDPDVVIIWQNGEVTRGSAELKAYYDKMMTGPDRRVQSVHADPQVTDRHLYGDWAVSWGKMNDEFIMTDGRSLKLDSQFTATIARHGPAWKVVSFHVSSNVFDNTLLTYAVQRTAIVAASIAGITALVLGFAAAWLIKRRRA